MQPYGGKRSRTAYTKRQVKWEEKNGYHAWKDFGLADVSKKRERRNGKRKEKED